MCILATTSCSADWMNDDESHPSCFGHLAGDISAFKATKDLTVLNLDLTHIFGDVQVFQATKSLIKLSLKSTDVTGAVVTFDAKWV